MASGYCNNRTNPCLDLVYTPQGFFNSTMIDSKSASPSWLSGSVTDAIAAVMMN